MTPHTRKSFMDVGQVFFWTATINDWKHLLSEDLCKKIIIDSLLHLKEQKLIHVLAYVIMPNHIHLIWKLNDYNGKELPSASFTKFTGHQFQKYLRDTNPALLEEYAVNFPNKRYEFWQRDSKAMHLYTTEMLLQKLNYIHNNPLQEHWKLSSTPEEYPFSSAKFYIDGSDKFDLVERYEDHF
tara:strand:- start:1 stop:549 length:549 start_codon:yes stop_codon:yes gene_type:complete